MGFTRKKIHHIALQQSELLRVQINQAVVVDHECIELAVYPQSD